MKYEPTFAEETFIVHGYGTEEEIDQFRALMEQSGDRGNRIEIIILIESIKQRMNLGLNWNCCWRCQRYNTCEINWVRGEKGIARTCCPNCQNYGACTMIFQSQRAGRCLIDNPEPPPTVAPSPSPSISPTL